jgi:hypothetical protein
MSALPVAATDWAALRQDAMASMPALPDGADGVLLGYQRQLLATVSAHAVTVYEKSRRIGATWGVGAQAVLTSGAKRTDGGMDSLYIGYNLDMAREFIGVCGMWAKALGMAAGEAGEFLFTDQDKDGLPHQLRVGVRDRGPGQPPPVAAWPARLRHHRRSRLPRRPGGAAEGRTRPADLGRQGAGDQHP